MRGFSQLILTKKTLNAFYNEFWVLGHQGPDLPNPYYFWHTRLWAPHSMQSEPTGGHQKASEREVPLSTEWSRWNKACRGVRVRGKCYSRFLPEASSQGVVSFVICLQLSKWIILYTDKGQVILVEDSEPHITPKMLIGVWQKRTKHRNENMQKCMNAYVRIHQKEADCKALCRT